MKTYQGSAIFFSAVSTISHQYSTLRMLIGIALAILISAIATWGVGPSTTAAQNVLDAQIQPDALGSISGEVSGQDGHPIPGAEVTLFAKTLVYDPFWGFDSIEYQPIVASTTDENGQYLIGALTTNIYRVRASLPDSTFLETSYQNGTTESPAEEGTNIPVSGNDIGNIDIVLPKGGRISGYLSTTDGMGLSEYNIQVYRLTDDLGYNMVINETYDVGNEEYVTTAIPAGTYRVCASSNPYPNYYDSRNLIECFDDGILGIMAAQDVVVDVDKITPNVDFALGESVQYAQVSGTLTGPNGEPATGVTVQAYPAPNGDGIWSSTTTDSLGRYVLDRLGPYGYFLKFLTGESPYLSQYYGGAVRQSEAEEISLEAGSIVVNMDEELAVGGQVSGRVLVQGKFPATNARIYIYSGSGSAWFSKSANADPATGEYTIRGLPEGYYELDASADGPANDSSYDRLSGRYPEDFDGEPISVTLGSLVSGIDISVGEGTYEGVIRGTVSDADGPLEGIQVTLKDTEGVEIFYTASDGSGQYAIEGLGSGIYYLFFRSQSNTHAPQYYGGGESLQNARPVLLSRGEIVEKIDVQLVPFNAQRRLIEQSGDVDAVGAEINLAPILYFPIIP